MDERKFIEEQIEKLAIMVAQGFEHTGKEISELRQEMATKEDIVRLEGDIERLEGNIERLEGKVDAGFGKQLQETDGLRDKMRVLETRVDRLETSHT